MDDAVRARSSGHRPVRHHRHVVRDHRRRHAGTLRLSGEPAPLAAAAHRRIPARPAHRTAGLVLRSPHAGRLEEQAQAELGTIAKGLAAESPEAYKNLQPRVATYGAPPIEDAGARMVVKIVYAANTVFLLLLAVICTNVATLVFARTATRGWEVAVRSALGATRRRIIAQLFAESLVLSRRRRRARDRRRETVAAVGTERDRRRCGAVLGERQLSRSTTVLYAGLLTMVAAVIVGVFPALRVTRLNVQDSLRREQAANASLRFGGVWTTVIVVQVAITVALLPLAPVLVMASDRFRQRADGRRRRQLPARPP